MDLKIQVRNPVIKNPLRIFHVFDIIEQKQILHELRFSFKKSSRFRWRPSLLQLEILSSYLKFLRALCEIKVRPTSQQMKTILHENQLTLLDLLFRRDYGLYCNTPLELEKEEIEELDIVLLRHLNHSYVSHTDVHLLVAIAQ